MYIESLRTQRTLFCQRTATNEAGPNNQHKQAVGPWRYIQRVIRSSTCNCKCIHAPTCAVQTWAPITSPSLRRFLALHYFPHFDMRGSAIGWEENLGEGRLWSEAKRKFWLDRGSGWPFLNTCLWFRCGRLENWYKSFCFLCLVLHFMTK